VKEKQFCLVSISSGDILGECEAKGLEHISSKEIDYVGEKLKQMLSYDDFLWDFIWRTIPELVEEYRKKVNPDYRTIIRARSKSSSRLRQAINEDCARSEI